MDALIYLTPPAAEVWHWYYRVDEDGIIPPLPSLADRNGLLTVLREAERNLQWLLMPSTGVDGRKPDDVARMVDCAWQSKVETLIRELRAALCRGDA